MTCLQSPLPSLVLDLVVAPLHSVVGRFWLRWNEWLPNRVKGSSGNRPRREALQLSASSEEQVGGFSIVGQQRTKVKRRHAPEHQTSKMLLEDVCSCKAFFHLLIEDFSRKSLAEVVGLGDVCGGESGDYQGPLRSC